MYTAGQVAGTAESIALGVVNPCGAGALASIGIKAVNGIEAVGNAWNFSNNMQAGNYGSAAMDALGLMGNVSQMLRACFAAGTPLLTPDGSKPIEDFRAGDLLLSASEDDPTGPIEPRRVEEIFQRVSAMVEVRVRGRSIRTTAEHPFYVQGKGWTAAALLAPGDLFRSDDGRWNPVESIDPTGEVATVYNMRIAEYHTYFVGSGEWGFSVWAHNKCSGAQLAANKQSGTAAEKAAVAWLRANNVTIVATQVSVMTAKGRRVIDILVQRGGKYLALEIKSGNAGRTLSQYLKDQAMAIGGATWRGKTLPPMATNVLFF
jgi:hypothetical protein